MMIYITGAGGTGKSTLVEGLKRELPQEEYDIHDIDEADLWGEESNYKAWKRAKIEHYLEQSKQNDQEGIDTVLCGIIYPQNVLNSDAYEGASARFILLDAQPSVIEDRWMVRHEEAAKNQEEWLLEKKVHHGKMTVSLKEAFSDKPNVELKEKPRVDIIDTSHISPQEILIQVRKILGA